MDKSQWEDLLVKMVGGEHWEGPLRGENQTRECSKTLRFSVMRLFESLPSKRLLLR